MHFQSFEGKICKRDEHQSGVGPIKYKRVRWITALQNETVPESYDGQRIGIKH